MNRITTIALMLAASVAIPALATERAEHKKKETYASTVAKMDKEIGAIKSEVGKLPKADAGNLPLITVNNNGNDRHFDLLVADAEEAKSFAAATQAARFQKISTALTQIAAGARQCKLAVDAKNAAGAEVALAQIEKARAELGGKAQAPKKKK